MSKAYKILPHNYQNLRARFEVKCGEYAKITSYGLCDGICVKINQIHEDKCRCIYDEKPFCLLGSQVGIDDSCPDAVIPMPGCYVAYFCIEEGLDWDLDDFAIYLDVCKDLDNLQAVLTAAGLK